MFNWSLETLHFFFLFALLIFIFSEISWQNCYILSNKNTLAFDLLLFLLLTLIIIPALEKYCLVLSQC